MRHHQRFSSWGQTMRLPSGLFKPEQIIALHAYKGHADKILEGQCSHLNVLGRPGICFNVVSIMKGEQPATAYQFPELKPFGLPSSYNSKEELWSAVCKVGYAFTHVVTNNTNVQSVVLAAIRGHMLAQMVSAAFTAPGGAV